MKTNNKKYKLLRKHKIHNIPSRMEYPKVVTAIAAITAATCYKIKDRINWKVFCYTNAVCLLLGCIWGAFHIHFDPVFSGWMYHPEAITGLDYIFTFGDWLFWPACGCMVICFMVIVPRKGIAVRWSAWYAFILFCKIVITMCFYLYGDLSCKLSCMCFAVPGILTQLKHRTYDIRHEILTMVFLCIFAALWDIVRPQWFYISWLMDTPFHSVVYHEFPRWWLFERIPIAILPWFALSGAWCIYGVYYYFKVRPASSCMKF